MTEYGGENANLEFLFDESRQVLMVSDLEVLLEYFETATSEWHEKRDRRGKLKAVVFNNGEVFALSSRRKDLKSNIYRCDFY